MTNPQTELPTAEMALQVKSLRIANGWSLQEAADRIGISKAHLWEFERGSSRNPTLRMIAGLANCYGLSLSDFLNGQKPSMAAETMAAFVSVSDAVKAAYRRGYADGQAAQ